MLKYEEPRLGHLLHPGYDSPPLMRKMNRLEDLNGVSTEMPSVSSTNKSLWFDLPAGSRGNTSCWSNEGDVLAYGHSQGSVLMIRQRNAETTSDDSKYVNGIQKEWQLLPHYIHVGTPTLCLDLTSYCLVSGHADYNVRYFTFAHGESGRAGQQVLLGGNSGHRGAILCCKASTIVQGVVASTAVDRTLRVWQDGRPHVYPLRGNGRKLLFFDQWHPNKLAVLENDSRIRVLDWQRQAWLTTIYAGSSLYSSGTPFFPSLVNTNSEACDFDIFEGDLIVVSHSWWKRFKLNSLSGGCGMTAPAAEGPLVGSDAGSLVAVSGLQAVSVNGRAGTITTYALELSSTYYRKSIEIQLPSSTIDSVSFNSSSGIVSLFCGPRIYLVETGCARQTSSEGLDHNEEDLNNNDSQDSDSYTDGQHWVSLQREFDFPQTSQEGEPPSPRKKRMLDEMVR